MVRRQKLLRLWILSIVLVGVGWSSVASASVSIYQCFNNQTQNNTYTYHRSAGFFHYDMAFTHGTWAMESVAPFRFKANVYRRDDARDPWAPVEETWATNSGGQWRWQSRNIDTGTGGELILLQITPAHPLANGTVLLVNLRSWSCTTSPSTPSAGCPPNECEIPSSGVFGVGSCRASRGCGGFLCGSPGCP